MTQKTLSNLVEIEQIYALLKQTIQIQWICNPPANDLCYTYDDFSRLDDTAFDTLTYRLVSLNKTVQADVKLSSQNPVRIVIIGRNIHYVSCPDKHVIKAKTLEPKVYDYEFERCLKDYCHYKQDHDVLTCQHTINLHLKGFEDFECLKKIKQIIIKPSDNQTFDLINNHFFRNAPNLQEITIRSDRIKLAPLFGLFGELNNLRVLKMPELEFTLPTQIIHNNPQLLFVETKTNRAWNLCTKIELIDSSTGIRNLEDFGENYIFNAFNQHTDTVANTYKGLEPKVKTFLNSLTANEISLCIVAVIFVVIILILFLGICKR